MKNMRIKKAFLAFLGCLSVPGFAAVTPVTPQLNTEDQCYHISNKAELFGFAALVNEGKRTICGKLDDNIVVNENVIKDGSFNSSAKESFDAWTPLENFSGKFDGNDKYISGLYSDASSGSAFVKSVLNGTSNAPVTIKNLGIVKSYFTSNTNYVGAFVGNSNTYLKISNSYIENTLVTGGNRIGGFIGSITSSVTTIENSFNRGTVMRETTEAGRIEDYAGFVGGIDGTGTLKISKCGYEGYVSGNRMVGGFLGYIGGNVVIENSYNRGSVVATADISGGFVGAKGSAGTLTIRNSYSAGTVTESGSVGDAFIGSAGSGTAPTVSNSYYLSTLSSSIGTSYEQTKFSDGTVAVKLHDYSDETDGVTGDAWGQDVTKENTYPDLSGKVLYPLTLVTYDGDANASTYPTKYAYKEAKALPTNVEREKHAFKGWYANSSFEGSSITSVASNEPGAKTYYAKFEKEFEVKFLDDDEKTEIKTTQVVENGQKAVQPENPARSEKYKFGGWYLDLNDEGASAYDFNKPVTSDISLYAYWIELITYVYKDADGNVLSTQYLTEEEVPVPPTEGLPTSENYKYLYSWDGRFDEETMVSTYTLVLDSVLKENKLAINATGFEAGNHIVIEQPSECVNVEGKLSPGYFESEDGVFSENLRSSQELSAYYDYYSYTLSTTLMINRVSDACKDDFYIKSFDYYKTMNVSLYADGKKKFEYVYDVTKNTAKLSDFQFDVGNYQYYEISFLDTNGVLVDVQSVIKSQMPKNPEVRDAGSDEKYIEFYDLPENVVPATQNASYTVSKTYKILRNSDYVVELDGLEAGKKIIVNNPSECVQLYFWLQGNGGYISDYESYTLEADAQYNFGIGHINIDWASEKCKDDIYIKSLAFNNKSAIYLKYKDNVVQGGEIYGFEKKTNIWGPLAFSTSKLYKISFYDEDGNLVSVNKFAAGETPYLEKSTTADGNFTIGYSSIDNFVAATKDTSYIVTADTTLDKIAVQLKDWKAGDYVELKNLSECVTLENVELIPQSSSSNAIDRRLSDNRKYRLGFDIHVDMNSEECQDDPYVKGINSTKGDVRIGILFPGGERFRYVGKTSFENPENGVLSFEYVFVTGAPEKHRVRIFDKNKKLVETQFVNNGSKARYRELKDKETEGYVYFYHLTEELANINGDHDYYETDVLDSVKKDYNIYISLSGAIAGDAIKMESPSECIVLAPMLLEGDNPPIEDLNYTLQENSDYVLLTFASIGFENEECNDETIKSVRYFMPNEIPIYLVMESDSLLTSYGYWNDGLYATGIRQPYIFSTGNVVLYNISFVDVDGNQIGETQKLLYNHKPVVPEVTLPKNNAQYTYSYHWDSKIVPAKGDFEYIAVLDSQVNAYTITVSVNDSKMGAVTGAGSYEYGAEITLVATALDGYKFSNWEDDAKAAATRKVSVTGEASYKANFEKIVVASSSSSSAKGSDVKPGSSSSEKPASSATKPGSSSSVIPGSDPESRNSSSSAKSSSSKKASSSSSVKPGSSSNVKPSSSSSVIPGSDPESRNSSSSAKRNSSSSAKKDAIVASAKVPMFSITVMGRSLQIAGAPVDAKIAVFDMQGGLVSTGRVDAANFNVAMPRSGSYMVRIGNQVQKVNVK